MAPSSCSNTITTSLPVELRLCHSHLILVSLSLSTVYLELFTLTLHIHLTILIYARWSANSFFVQARSHSHATYYFAHNCCTVSLSLSMIHPYWQAMVTTAWIYSIQFKFWPPQLHQHLHLHSRCHLKNKTYPPTPHLHWHQYLHFKQPLQMNDYHFGHASVYTTTFLLYSCLVFYYIKVTASCE